MDGDLGISMLDSYERVRPMDKKKERKCPLLYVPVSGEILGSS